jgi:hypothetical protein
MFFYIKESTPEEGGLKITPIRGGIRPFLALQIGLNLLDNDVIDFVKLLMARILKFSWQSQFIHDHHQRRWF